MRTDHNCNCSDQKLGSLLRALRAVRPSQLSFECFLRNLCGLTMRHDISFVHPSRRAKPTRCIFCSSLSRLASTQTLPSCAVMQSACFDGLVSCFPRRPPFRFRPPETPRRQQCSSSKTKACVRAWPGRIGRPELSRNTDASLGFREQRDRSGRCKRGGRRGYIIQRKDRPPLSSHSSNARTPSGPTFFCLSLVSVERKSLQAL